MRITFLMDKKLFNLQEILCEVGKQDEKFNYLKHVAILWLMSLLILNSCILYNYSYVLHLLNAF